MRRLERPASVASVVAALLPVGVATARAVHRGWLPVGDNALSAIRARDVLTDHHPLLGTWSSASLATGTHLNHPGPLLFDLLAIPVRLFDRGAGVAIGVATVNGLAIIGIGVLAHRLGGPLVVTAAMSVTAALCWAMGSELLFEPWNPYSVLLPFLCFLMLVWSVACGEVTALPWAVGIGSLVVQTHLSYGLLLPALGAWAVAGLALALRRARHRDPPSWPPLRRRAVRSVVVAGGVLVACWAQPLVEQLSGDGDGNLTRLARTVLDPAATLGAGLGARLVATVVALPPWWLRPSFRDPWLPSPPPIVVEPADADLASSGMAAAGLLLVVGVLAWCGWDARRRHDSVALVGVATGLVVLTVGLITMTRAPVTFFGVAPHQYRWLWPVGAFVCLCVLATLARRLAPRPVPPSWLVAGFALAAAVFASLNLPTSRQVEPNTQTEWSVPVVRDLARQMTAVEGRGRLLVDGLLGERFADPYGPAVLAELQHRGVAFVVDDAPLVRQLGPSRRFDGDNAQAALFLRTGDATRNGPPGTRAIALHDGLTSRQRRELAALTGQIGQYIRQDGLRLNERGQAALEKGELPTLRRQRSTEHVDPEPLLASREFLVMVREDLLLLDNEWERRSRRYADLQFRWDNETVAIFIGPVAAAS
jgi:hypothetical protein